MRLKSITGLTRIERDACALIYKGIEHLKIRDVVASYSISHGHAQKSYFGNLIPGVEITEFELAMLFDGGYSWFGGQSTINSDGSFSVTIYID